jgi:hypothetical protein
MRKQLIARLYEILENHKNTFGYNYLLNPIPNDFECGIYFFYDKITTIENGQFKITYIGITKNNKNNRLDKHKINGPSSFRDHVNKALENLQGISTPNDVNNYIHNLPYLFIKIPNVDDLTEIEKTTIGLVSNYNKISQIHIPNKNWLGYHHLQSIIPKAHIWNIQHAKTVENKFNPKNCIDPLNKLNHYSKLIMK